MMTFDYDSVPASALKGIVQSALTTERGLRHGYLCARHVVQHSIAGAIVECGVAFGAQVGMMARAIAAHGDRRAFHLFDSFEGIPMAGPQDEEQPGIGVPIHDTDAPLSLRLVSSGVSVGTIQTVQANLAAWGCDGDFTYHHGWFQHTLPALDRLPPIAVLRLDGDLYESTMCCLQYLYPRVVRGGLVVVDDYALGGCRKAVHDYLNTQHLSPNLQVEDVGGGSRIVTWVA